MFRAVPRLASAAAAGAAASVTAPATVQNEAYSGPDRLEDPQNFTKSPKSSSARSSVLFSPTSSVEWDFVLKEEGCESGILGPIATSEEAAEAVQCVFETLRGEQVHGQSHSRLSGDSLHSWPEADASMAASERAIQAARQAMGSSDTQYLSIQGLTGPTSSTLIRAIGPLREVFDLLEQRPEEAKKVVESLASDSNVWTAFEQNPTLQAFMKQSGNVVIEEANTAEGETAADWSDEKETDDTENGDTDGPGSFIWRMLEKFTFSLKSILGNFMDAMKGHSGKKSSKRDVDPEIPHMYEVPSFAGIFVLVLLTVMVVLYRRKVA